MPQGTLETAETPSDSSLKSGDPAKSAASTEMPGTLEGATFSANGPSFSFLRNRPAEYQVTAFKPGEKIQGDPKGIEIVITSVTGERDVIAAAVSAAPSERWSNLGFSKGKQLSFTPSALMDNRWSEGSSKSHIEIGPDGSKAFICFLK